MRKLRLAFSYVSWTASIYIIVRGLGSIGRDLEEYRQERKARK